jgi:hypothetical protein
MSFDEDLDSQLATERDTAEVDVIVAGKLQTFRFTEMDGLEWADLTDRCPPRADAAVDRGYGFNIRAVTALAAPKCGQMRDGDAWVDLTEEQWTKLFRGQKGAQVRAIGDALFELNQWGPGQAVLAARKALGVGSARSSSSPEA